MLTFVINKYLIISFPSSGEVLSSTIQNEMPSKFCVLTLGSQVPTAYPATVTIQFAAKKRRPLWRIKKDSLAVFRSARLGQSKSSL